MTSPLPPDCKFYVYPRYVIVYEGRIVKLAKNPAKILLILMSKPGKPFTTRDIAQTLYDDREDGGPLWNESAICVHVCRMLKKFAKAGLSLDLKSGFSKQTFIYRQSSISLLGHEGEASVAESVNVPLWPKPQKKRKQQPPKKTRQRQRYKYNTEFFVPERDPELWVFPQHMENRLARLATRSQPDHR